MTFGFSFKGNLHGFLAESAEIHPTFLFSAQEGIMKFYVHTMMELVDADEKLSLKKSA
jgi:hypothetical protein